MSIEFARTHTHTYTRKLGPKRRNELADRKRKSMAFEWTVDRLAVALCRVRQTLSSNVNWNVTLADGAMQPQYDTAETRRTLSRKQITSYQQWMKQGGGGGRLELCVGKRGQAKSKKWNWKINNNPEYNGKQKHSWQSIAATEQQSSAATHTDPQHEELSDSTHVGVVHRAQTNISLIYPKEYDNWKPCSYSVNSSQFYPILYLGIAINCHQTLIIGRFEFLRPYYTLNNNWFNCTELNWNWKKSKTN